MKHHFIFAAVLVLLVGLGVYQVKEHKANILAGVADTGLFASVFTASSAGLPVDCQSVFLLAPLQKNVQDIRDRIAALPTPATVEVHIASTTKALTANEALLKKATVTEVAAVKKYTADKAKYSKLLVTYQASLAKTLSQVNTTTNAKTLVALKKTASSTEANIQKTQASLIKIETTYTTVKNNTQKYRDIKSALTVQLSDLKNGTTKATLTKLLDDAQRLLADMQKRKNCPVSEGIPGSVFTSNKYCTDHIDNNADGKTDCEDPTCISATSCREVNPGTGIVVTTGGGTNTGNTSGSGVCSDPQYTTKAACEAAVYQSAPGYCDQGAYLHDEAGCTDAGANWTPPTMTNAGLTWDPDGGDDGSGKDNNTFKCCVCFKDEGAECNSAGYFDNIGEVRGKRCEDFFADEKGCDVQKTVARDRNGNNIGSTDDVRNLCGSEEAHMGRTIDTSFFYAGHSCSVMVVNECMNATYSVLNTYKKSAGKIKSTHDGCSTFPLEKRGEALAYFNKLVSDLKSADMTAEITLEGNQLNSQTNPDTGEKMCETGIGFRVCQNGIDIVLQDCPANKSLCTEPGKSIDCKDPSTGQEIHPTCQQLPGMTLNNTSGYWYY